MEQKNETNNANGCNCQKNGFKNNAHQCKDCNSSVQIHHENTKCTVVEFEGSALPSRAGEFPDVDAVKVSVVKGDLLVFIQTYNFHLQNHRGFSGDMKFYGIYRLKSAKVDSKSTLENVLVVELEMI